LLVSGKLSDIFGRKIWFIIASVLGIIGGIVGATAKTTTAIIVYMVFMGIATALASVTTPAFFEIVPYKHRGMVIGFLELSSLPWFVFASLIANSLFGAGQWRWIYYISIIMNTLALAGIVLCYKPPKRPEASQRSVWAKLAELDWIGIILFIGGLTVYFYWVFSLVQNQQHILGILAR